MAERRAGGGKRAGDHVLKDEAERKCFFAAAALWKVRRSDFSLRPLCDITRVCAAGGGAYSSGYSVAYWIFWVRENKSQPALEQTLFMPSRLEKL